MALYHNLLKEERMLVTQDGRSTRTIAIPCVLNRASMGDAEYVFVRLQNLIDHKGKVAWVPRKKLVIEKQDFQGKELRALLTVEVKEEAPDRYLVSLLNSGSEEILSVLKTP